MIEISDAARRRRALLSKRVISPAELECRVLFLKLTNRFFDPALVHKDNYSHTGPNSPEAADLPSDIDGLLLSDDESVPLPSRDKIKDSLRFG
jgi:hypothetical protein